MKTLTLHFGMRKTGSTSIQSTLFNAELPAGTHYLHFGTPNASRHLLTAFCRDPHMAGQNLREGHSDDTLAEMRRSFRQQLSRQLNAPFEHGVLSAESLFKLSEGELGQLAELIRKRGCDCRAVAYVRPLRSAFTSLFQQRIKVAQSLPALSDIDFGFREQYEKFDRAFGRQQVQFWLFQPKALHQQCVVQDFCKRVGLSIPEEQIKRENDSLSRPALSLLYIFRYYADPPLGSLIEARIQQRLMTRLAQCKGAKLQIQAEVIAPIQARYADQIEWMETRLGASLSDTDDHAQDGLRRAEDLLDCPPEAITWLSQATSTLAPEPLSPEASGPQIAERMGLLRKLIASQVQARHATLASRP